MGRQDHRSSRMVARVDDHTRRPASPRGRERSEEVFFTTNHAGVPEPPVWLSCVAAVRTGPAVFAARPSGAVRLRGSGIEAGAGANRGARGWLPGGGVVYALGRATVAGAPVARRRRHDANPVSISLGVLAGPLREEVGLALRRNSPGPPNHPGPAQSRTRRRDGCGGGTYHGLSSLPRTRSIRTSSGAIVMPSPSGTGSITSTPHSRSAAAEARALGWFQSGMLAEIATITGVPRPIASAATDSARLSAMPAASLLSEPNEHGATSTSPNGGLGRIASSK